MVTGNVTVSHVAMHLNGSEGMYILPDYVVAAVDEHRLVRGGFTANSDISIRYDASGRTDLVTIPDGCVVNPRHAVAVLGPDYLAALDSTPISRELFATGTELDMGFKLISDAPYTLRQARTEIALRARRAINDVLHKSDAAVWPDQADLLLLLILADPDQPLQDRLAFRGLRVRLTDALAVDRVAAFDAQRLGISVEQYFQVLDRWIERLALGSSAVHELMSHPSGAPSSLVDPLSLEFPDEAELDPRQVLDQTNAESKVADYTSLALSRAEAAAATSPRRSSRRSRLGGGRSSAAGRRRK